MPAIDVDGFDLTTGFAQLFRHKGTPAAGILDCPRQCLALQALLVGMEELVFAQMVLQTSLVGLFQQGVQKFKIVDGKADRLACHRHSLRLLPTLLNR